MSIAVVDLFAGAGGLSYGLHQAGFNVALALEQDLWAADTYRANHSSTKLIVEDIRGVSDERLQAYKGADILVGGPPCQGFSISASNRRKPDDPRNLLYLQFLRAVPLIQPKVILIENVKEIRQFRLEDGRLLCDDIQSRLANLGYQSVILTLNAASFGIPQSRARTFLIAALKKLKFSAAVHELLSTQQAPNLFSEKENVVNLWDAISDLPPVIPWELEEDAVSEYILPPVNSYQALLRNGSRHITNHVPMKHTGRMIERFKHLIGPLNETTRILPQSLSPRTRGNSLMISKKIYDQNHRRLDPYKLSPTITASFYSSFIHPYQPRNLTVREAARLQSFPDNYIFKGKRTTLSKKLLARKGEVADLHLDQFNQVGNSVPPLLAYRLGNYLKKIIYS
ncbi:DNA (cytosine-5)-methyltransferase 1 [Nitrosospira sp. Nsp18]|uniref:DNA cytosine methyltransferase n=1 Tax=Nitrosospira sp. Nsp18 TaxID=1855334 RepID=UPI000886D3B5|nr:DNA cytosine methyltransferase [Nitrosospira sp. Nsp18]SDA14851.1 DNA (cytosine-5)-methyltransferase 1 [Nitrosospira sp. Nsp18]